jgi:hypothetical protein
MPNVMQEYWYQATDVWQNERLMRFVPHEPVMARSLRRQKAEAPWDYHHFATAQSVASVANAGGSVHAGAHGQLQAHPPPHSPLLLLLLLLFLGELHLTLPTLLGSWLPLGDRHAQPGRPHALPSPLRLHPRYASGFLLAKARKGTHMSACCAPRT